jgi:hypothetical protein
VHHRLRPEITKGGSAVPTLRLTPKFRSNSLKVLKISHILLVVLFLGGALSSFAVLSELDLSDFEDVTAGYKITKILSETVVEIGAQEIILLGLVYGFFTKWGFIKHKWLALKWLLFIAQTFIGILIVDKLMMANIALLETEEVLALTDPVFIHNHFLRQDVVLLQIGLTLLALIVSVLKPGRRRAILRLSHFVISLWNTRSRQGSPGTTVSAVARRAACATSASGQASVAATSASGPPVFCQQGIRFPEPCKGTGLDP